MIAALRKTLFGGWVSSIVTVLLALVLWRGAAGLLDWAVVRGHGFGATPAMCRADGGACWAVIGEKYRFILFGRYPYEAQWRPAIVIGVFLALFGVSAFRACWRPMLGLVWVGALAIVLALMWGGFAGMEYVPQDSWGGLPITLLLSSVGCVLAFPLAVLVALGRRARSMPAVRAVCVLYVELVRGVPLVALLFMASVMLPLFLPEGLNPDKLLRAQVAIILFAAAYLAEVVRGGLQALPRGQYEAADALGLSYWQTQLRVILPQALRLVVPPLVNTFTGLFKDTSLVLIIGLLDLLTAGKVALADPVWQPFGEEVYLLLAAIYFAFCFFLSRASRRLEAS